MRKKDINLAHVMRQMADEEFEDLKSATESNKLSITFSPEFMSTLNETKINAQKTNRHNYVKRMNKKLVVTFLTCLLICLSIVQINAADNSDIYFHYDSNLKKVEVRSKSYIDDKRFISKKIKKTDGYTLKNVPEYLELEYASKTARNILLRWRHPNKQHLFIDFMQTDPAAFNLGIPKYTVFSGAVDSKIGKVYIYDNTIYDIGYMLWIHDGYCFSLCYGGFSNEDMLEHIQNDVIKE